MDDQLELELVETTTMECQFCSQQEYLIFLCKFLNQTYIFDITKKEGNCWSNFNQVAAL